MRCRLLERLIRDANHFLPPHLTLHLQHRHGDHDLPLRHSVSTRSSPHSSIFWSCCRLTFVPASLFLVQVLLLVGSCPLGLLLRDLPHATATLRNGRGCCHPVGVQLQCVHTISSARLLARRRTDVLLTAFLDLSSHGQDHSLPRARPAQREAVLPLCMHQHPFLRVWVLAVSPTPIATSLSTSSGYLTDLPAPSLYRLSAPRPRVSRSRRWTSSSGRPRRRRGTDT